VQEDQLLSNVENLIGSEKAQGWTAVSGRLPGLK
jgi:hypothetical protein